MKKQNTNNKLAFNKAAVIELNDDQLSNLNGGTTTGICLIALISITVAVYYSE